jgi:DNA repair ATPase RecN
MTEKVALILFGWLLGLLSPIVADAIKTRYKKEEFRKAIISELKGIQYRLAGNVYSLNRRFGKIDKQLLLWVSEIFKSYTGIYAETRSMEALERQLKLSDEELEDLGEIMKPDKREALTLRKFTTPFLDSHIGSLSLFSQDFQLKLFEIKSQLGFLNDQIEDAKFYFQRTFGPDLSTNNYDLISSNLEECYRSIAEKAKTIADAINF